MVGWSYYLLDGRALSDPDKASVLECARTIAEMVRVSKWHREGVWFLSADGYYADEVEVGRIVKNVLFSPYVNLPEKEARQRIAQDYKGKVVVTREEE